MDAQPTIRDEISRRARPVNRIAAMAAAGLAIAGGVFALASAHARHTGHAPIPPQAMAYALLGMMFLVGIAVTLMVRLAASGAKCPKCGSLLGPFAYLMKDSPKLKKINFCPYCAVNLDEPMPVAPPAAENVTTPDKLVWK